MAMNLKRKMKKIYEKIDDFEMEKGNYLQNFQ